jgi:hypothetical protein
MIRGGHTLGTKINPWWPRLILAFMFIFMLAVFILACEQMKRQQLLIEDGIREKIGLWLKDQIKAKDRIFLECLGYIGYFSQGRMLDYPGLASPEVVKLKKEKQRDFITLIPELKPEWLVLRPYEINLVRRSPFIRNNYQGVLSVDEYETIQRLNIAGKGYLLGDSCFQVFKYVPATQLSHPVPISPH